MDGSNESAEHETLMQLLKSFERNNPNCYGNVEITDGIITRVFFGLPHAKAGVEMGGPIAVEARFGSQTKGGVFIVTVPTPKNEPLPIAIAFAQQETDENWQWVWSNLAQCVPHVTKVRRIAKPAVYPILSKQFSEGVNGVCSVYLSQDMLAQKAITAQDLPQFKRAVASDGTTKLQEEVTKLPSSAQQYLAAQYPPSAYGGHGNSWNNVSGSSKYLTRILGDADYVPWVIVTNNMLEELQRQAPTLM